jgi:hypothetical protein
MGIVACVSIGGSQRVKDEWIAVSKSGGSGLPESDGRGTVDGVLWRGTGGNFPNNSGQAKSGRLVVGLEP